MRLGCEVDSYTVDLKVHKAWVHVPQGNCTDMGATVSFFLELDPDVTSIETFVGGHIDTWYVRQTDNNWKAVS